jgi:hypothetical protein
MSGRNEVKVKFELEKAQGRISPSSSEGSAEESDRTFSVEDKQEDEKSFDSAAAREREINELDDIDDSQAYRVYDARFKIPAKASI